MTLPEGLTLEKDGEDTFDMTLHFQSDVRVIEPRNVTVLRSGNTSYSFNVTLQLNLGEQVTFYASWIAKTSRPGTSNVSFLAMSNDPDVDQNYRSVEDSCEVRVVEDVPIVSGFTVSGSYRMPEIDPQATYIYPDRGIVVRCEARSVFGMKNVTLYFSTDQGETWSWEAMIETVAGEWEVSLSAQADGASLYLYASAFSLRETSIKTDVFVFQVVDLRVLDVKTMTLVTSTVTVITVCSAVYVLWRRRRMIDIL